MYRSEAIKLFRLSNDLNKAHLVKKVFVFLETYFQDQVKKNIVYYKTMTHFGIRIISHCYLLKSA